MRFPFFGRLNINIVIKVNIFVINSETVEISRKRWELMPCEMPHIFPNLPNYFTKPHMKQKSPNDRCREIQTHKKVKKDDRCEKCSTCEEQRIDHSEADSMDIHRNYLIKKE